MDDKISKKIVFWGGTYQSITLREYLPADMKLVAIFDNNPDLVPPFPDVPLYHGIEGFRQWKNSFDSNEAVYFAVAIGGDKGRVRCEIGEFLRSESLIPYSFIHPSAIISPTAKLGEGVQIMAGAVIDANVSIGDYTILNIGANIAHCCRLGRGVHVSVGAHIGGNCKIDDFATIYIGASIAPHLHIGSNSIVGLGTALLRDVPPSSLVYGNPGKIR